MPASVSSAPPAVEFRNVRKGFSAGHPVLDGFTLSVGNRETVALLGPSGSGKTTALKLVNRLLAADGGTVCVLGRDVAGEDPVLLRRRIGYVIQEGGLLPHWTVEENVATVPRLLGWTPERRHARAIEVLATVNLPASEFADRRPRELSGGQRQRVGVARALAADPVLVLMDEPFGALDPIARRALQSEFLAWKRELGKPVLFVTHDLPEAFRLSDRVAVLNAGRLVQVGTPREILDSPADDFVRAFTESASP
jgi:osmoprotectant transport system ATP-binding protein